MELSKRLELYGIFMLSILVDFSIQQANTPPAFTNLPQANNIPVEENTAITSEVFRVTATDADMGDAVTFSMTSAPSIGSLYFVIDSSNGAITVDSEINYEYLFNESATQFVFSIVATDNIDTTTRFLTIDIIDQQEGLTFNQVEYGVTAPEGQPANTYLPDPGFSVTDPDIGDTYYCSMACPVASAGDFTMNTTLCRVYFTGIYSLDYGDPASVVCTITAIDGGGNTDTTTLTITILDVDNYTPSFSLPTYVFSMVYYDPVGTTLAPAGIITATDQDTGTNGMFGFYLDQTGLPSDYFQLDPTSGMLTTQQEIPDTCNCPGATLTVPLHAVDQGGRTGTSTILINVGSVTTPPSTTTTPRPRTFLDEPKNAAWLALCIIAALAALLAGFFICFKYVRTCPRNLCQQRRRRPHRRFIDDDFILRDTPIESVRKHPPPLHSWQQNQIPILP